MPRRIWTPDRVIEELKRTRCNGPRANRKLDDAARRCFGSVRAALEVAGLPCGQPERRTSGWSKNAVVEAIRQRHRNGESLVRTNREDRALYRLRSFGMEADGSASSRWISATASGLLHSR